MCKSLLGLKKSLVLAFACLASMGASAQTQITDEDGLKAIANDLAGEYVLAADITLSGDWYPLGNAGEPFTGIFNGDGHTIKRLNVAVTVTNGNGDLEAADNLGLFGVTDGATISNVFIIDGKVAGNHQAGLLVGQAIGTTIEKVFTSGVVTGYDHIGGIIGDAKASSGGESTSVENCMSVAGAYSTDHQAGVIAGWANGGEFYNNLALGSAAAPANGAGGIVGLLDNGVVIAHANVNAAGSIQGYSANRCHGIVGWKNGDGSAYDALNNLSSTATIFKNNAGDVIDHDDLLTVCDSGEDGNAPLYQGEETDPATLKTAATYASIGWDESVWDLADGSYPKLKGVPFPVDGDLIKSEALPEKCVLDRSFDTKAFATSGKTVTITSSDPTIVSVEGTTIKFLAEGTATITLSTETDDITNGVSNTFEVTVSTVNYNISTPEELLAVKSDPTGEYYLMNDIDMAGVEFSPLPDFTGIFHGQGHVIKNLTFNDPNQDQAALFSTTHGATIEKLGFVGANIVGNANTAAIVGRAYGGTINSCYVANSYIEGRDHVASIVGDMNRNGDVGVVVSNCLSDSRIKSRSYQAGGMAGVANGGQLANSLFCGTVDLNGGNVSGLISLLDNNDWSDYPTTIANNFSAPAHLLGNVSFDDRLIHLAGRGASFSNNYALGSTKISSDGATYSDAGDPDAAAGATIDTETARTKDFFENTLGWDFTSEWKFFEGAEGKMYPVLSWMTAPLPTVIYDMPQDVALLYTDGSEAIDITTIHGSWGQVLDFTLTQGSDIASYIAEDKKIYAGDEDGYFAGTGDVVVKVSADPSIAALFDIQGDDSFSFYVGQSGEVKQIATAEDFLAIQKNLNGDYELANDIDMTGVEFKGLACNGSPFTGSLDGAGHKVINLKVSFPASQENNKGVFGETSGATFKNLAIENMIVDGVASGSGENHVGFVGSAANTTFDQVAVTGDVYGRDHVALLCGDADGVTVTNSYIWGQVTGYMQVGGFFGCTLEGGATITNSYYNGVLAATYRGWTGGFVGLIDKGNSEVTILNSVSIGDCYNTGDGSPHVTAPFIAGNGAGDTNAKITFKDNLYNSSAVMGADTEWPGKNETLDGGEVEAATGVSAGSLKQQETYEAIGWDFTSVWGFDSGSDYEFPILQQFGNITNGIKTIDKRTGATVALVSAANNVLSVAGLDGAAQVNVATVAGQTVGAVKTVGSTTSVRLPGKGLYIVTIKNNGVTKSYKVINK